MLLIFFFSSISSGDLPDFTFRIWDKILHFFAFGFLGILVYRSLYNASRPAFRSYALRYSMIITIVYGAIDEIHQYFVPGRFMSMTDWIADALGAIVCIFLYRWVIAHKNKHQNTGNLANTGR
jgi:VanZ family protein